MRNGICPKCNSTEIYHCFSKSDLDCGLKADASVVMVNFHKSGKGLFGDDFSLFALDVYLCRNCGYIEPYVSQADLEKMSPRLEAAANWTKVNPG